LSREKFSTFHRECLSISASRQLSINLAARQKQEKNEKHQLKTSLSLVRWCSKIPRWRGRV